MLSNQLFYKVLNERTIIVAQDTTAKRNQYEEQVVRTFFLSHVDPTEMAQILAVMRIAGMAIQPQIVPNKTTNTLVVRASTSVVGIIERIIEANDKPRAEVTLDVEILEVNRARVKELGLNLTEYAIGGIFSPEQAPPGALGGTGTGTTSSRPFNLNVITQGVSTADFYLAVPQAIVNFLETDTRTKVLAQTQLRGAEGQQLTLNIGGREPYLTTTFSPLAAGGANVNQVGAAEQTSPLIMAIINGHFDLAMDLLQRGADPNAALGHVQPAQTRFGSYRRLIASGEFRFSAR